MAANSGPDNSGPYALLTNHLGDTGQAFELGGDMPMPQFAATGAPGPGAPGPGAVGMSMEDVMNAPETNINSDSNPTIPYGYTLKHDTLGAHHALTENALVVMLKSAPTGSASVVRKYSVMSPVMANYALIMACVRVERPELDQHDLNWVLNTFALNGVGRNSEDTDEGRRVLNVVVGGRCTVFNVWGGTYEHQRLFIIIKRVKRTLLPAVWTVDTGRSTVAVTGEKLDMVWQMIPWSRTGFDYVPREELRYYDDWGNEMYGVAIPVGRAHHGGRVPTEMQLAEAHSNMVKTAMLPTFEMHVNIGLPEQ